MHFYDISFALAKNSVDFWEAEQCKSQNLMMSRAPHPDRKILPKPCCPHTTMATTRPPKSTTTGFHNSMVSRFHPLLRLILANHAVRTTTSASHITKGSFDSNLSQYSTLSNNSKYMWMNLTQLPSEKHQLYPRFFLPYHSLSTLLNATRCSATALS